MKHASLVVIGMILAAAQARGSIGGPALAKPLGWDPREQKVFASITFHRPSATLASLWAIPGRRERLLIVSNIGPDPESAYEVQTPVLLSGTSDDLVSVETIPHP